MRNKLLLCLAAGCAVAATGLYYYSFPAWIPALFALSAALYGVSVGLLTGVSSAKKGVLKGVLAGLVYTACFFGVNFLVNNIILHESKAKLATVIVLAVNLVFFLIFVPLISRGKKLPKPVAAAAFILSAVLVAGMSVPAIIDGYYNNYAKPVASPAAGKEPEEKTMELVKDADFYVSPQGSDENEGTFGSPFLTLEKARDAVRAFDRTGKTGVTVAVMAGEYRVDSFVLAAEDGGTKDCPVTWRAYGDGEAVLNGGATLPHSAFKAVTDDAVRDRLSDNAKDNVLSVDLSALGVTAEQYGKIYAIGGYNTASKYDGDWVGDIYCELFVDDARQTVARYPNGKEYLYTGDVVSEGQGRESAGASIKDGYDGLRNPEPDVYKIDKELSDRIASWKTTEDVWMFGYWRYDWADASTPLGAVDHENLTMSPLFVSTYGAKKDAPYYFFNVLEELDAPGEWYLDRENGVLYFYPPEDFSDDSVVELSLSTDNVLRIEADHLVFDGFTVKGTRGDAVSVTGDGNVVRNCLIKNAAGNALIVNGYDNLVADNEITRTGKGGVTLSGGDRETLKAGNNRAENNLVHDWSEIYETYQPAFSLGGVGNVCSHNEMYNSPHEAITYSGNDHLIEYNLIHDVNLLTDDGGAIYSGRRWDWYGTVIRYNLIYDLGADGHKPQGIYMDDALSGQSIYGNIMINVPDNGMLLGGGRDLDVHDNIVINSYNPISYDERGRSGLSGDESNSFYQHYKEGGSVWQLLFDSPWQSDAWRKAYPQYQHLSSDFSDPDNKDLAINPSYSVVTHNLLISGRGTVGNIAPTVYKYSTVEDNAVFRLSAIKKLFVDPENGDYTLREDAKDLIGFEIDVPAMNEFGRK